MPLDIAAVLVDPETAASCLMGAAAAASVDSAARIEGFHARLKPESMILPTEEVLTAARQKSLEAAASARSGQLQKVFRDWAAASGLAAANAQWQEVLVESVDNAVAARGRAADLIALVRPANPEGNAALHAAIFETGRPLLLLPRRSVCRSFGKHLAIAWKASGPAERAVVAAKPWLRRAERISVLMIGEAGDAQAALPAELSALLEGHGPRPDVLLSPPGKMTVGERLLRMATEINADGLVMGAYQHPRIMEMILGGVTREALHHAELPLFLMH